MACPALNSMRQRCRFPHPRANGWCPYHDPYDTRWPGRQPEPDPRLPSLKARVELIRDLRPWAEAFDALDRRRYPATEFVAWLEGEYAPPRQPKGDHERSYPVVGEGAALALR